MENVVPAADFDALKIIDDIHRILSSVTISGAVNIHHMDVALNGLTLLYNHLKEEKEQAQIQDQKERQEI